MARAPQMIQSFDRSIKLALDKVSDVDRPRLFARAASAATREAADINERTLGYAPKQVRVVDGVIGAPFEAVRPGGKAVVRFEVATGLAAEMVQDVYDRLVRNSPVGPPKDTGKRGPHYRDAFIVLVDDKRLRPPFTDIPDDFDEIVLVNPRPYARKIEGNPGLRPLSSQRPNGVIEETMREARSRWRQFAFSYSYKPVARIFAAGNQTTGARRGRTGSRSVASVTRASSFPAIFISLR